LPERLARLEADAVRLAQVFSNLLINAAKYTDPNGHIQLRAATPDQRIAQTLALMGKPKGRASQR
jgi:signal transduction histidine kinase